MTSFLANLWRTNPAAPATAAQPEPVKPQAALIDRLRALLVAEEGLRLKVYDDATGKPIGPGDRLIGHPTIGIGRALDTKGLSQLEADYLLDNDLTELAQKVPAAVGDWFNGLSETRQMVLLAMAFQMGLAGLLAFRNTLAAVREGRWDDAAAGMLASKWAQQTPKRAARMAALMRQG